MFSSDTSFVGMWKGLLLRMVSCDYATLINGKERVKLRYKLGTGRKRLKLKT